MKSIKNFIIESSSNFKDDEYNNVKEYIKSFLEKKGYKDDEYKITKAFGNEIRVYFSPNIHNNAFSEIGKLLDKKLHKANLGISHKTIGKDTKTGYYYHVFRKKL